MTGIGAVVLAAGEASRFGTAKQLLLLPDVLARLASAGPEIDLRETVIVEGAHVLAGVAGSGPHAHVVPCARWRAGPGASLRCGLEALAALDSELDAAVVLLADGPDLAPGALVRVVSEWREQGGDVVAASYGGVRGHPLLVARAAWTDVPDDGLRDRPARLVACDDLGFPGDVDTPADLPARFRRDG